MSDAMDRMISVAKGEAVTPALEPTVAQLLEEFRPALQRPHDETPVWSHKEVVVLLNALAAARGKAIEEAVLEMARYSCDEELTQDTRQALYNAGLAVKALTLSSPSTEPLER